MNKSVNQKTKLSVIILNYTSGSFLKNCLQSLFSSKLKNHIQLIVVDNASTDNSIKTAKKLKNKNQKITIKYLELKKNIGFAAGNNRGVKIANPSSDYLLFLNPDTIVNPDTIQSTIDFLDQNPKASAVTAKIILALTGKLQPECHRGFPTPWRAFCQFSGLIKLFPKSKFLAGYFLGHLDKNKIHLIESCVGAFLAIKRSAGNSIGWWNEKYFFYGDDLDFCYRLHQKNHKLFFNPHFSIIHYQGISSGIKSQTQKISTATRLTRLKVTKASTKAMRIFYQDHLLPKYSKPIQALVMLGIKLLETLRITKTKYL